MKLAFIVYKGPLATQVRELLDSLNIDYYTRWENVLGKGHGTAPHFGTTRALGGFGSTNDALMIAFENEKAAESLKQALCSANAEIKTADDKIRMFLVPLACAI